RPAARRLPGDEPLPCAHSNRRLDSSGRAVRPDPRRRNRADRRRHLVRGAPRERRRSSAVSLRQLALVIVAQTAQVAGQLLLKKGMSGAGRRVARVAGGTAMLTFWFLAWLKLLQELDI